jgi:hypothetical protein
MMLSRRWDDVWSGTVTPAEVKRANGPEPAERGAPVEARRTL